MDSRTTEQKNRKTEIQMLEVSKTRTAIPDSYLSTSFLSQARASDREGELLGGCEIGMTLWRPTEPHRKKPSKTDGSCHSVLMATQEEKKAKDRSILGALFLLREKKVEMKMIDRQIDSKDIYRKIYHHVLLRGKKGYHPASLVIT